jgi:DNA-binding XRE family transcriptional regulator
MGGPTGVAGKLAMKDIRRCRGEEMNELETGTVNLPNSNARLACRRRAQTEPPPKPKQSPPKNRAPEPIGDRLRAARALRKLTLHQLASRANVAYVTAWGAESGADIRLSILRRIAAALSIELTDLFNDEKWPKQT